jgi:hypothetical protein
MNDSAFYSRPMVLRLKQIFNDPSPPAKVTESQFDGGQKELKALARKPWHEVGQKDYWYYLMDLAYEPLQQDLFDYVFPAFLICWWEGQLSRTGGPNAETDFYYALDHGQALYKMMPEERRAAVLQWMVDAYMDGVDNWSGKLSVDPIRDKGDDLHGPLWSFHALGQSVPMIPALWEELSRIQTPGRAQWWLVLGIGLAYPENQFPHIPAWTPERGGGGVYVLESSASIYDHGYLTANLDFIREACIPESLIERLEVCRDSLATDFDREYAELTLAQIRTDPDRFARRVTVFVEFLGKPDLGGVSAARGEW